MEKKITTNTFSFKRSPKLEIISLMAKKGEKWVTLKLGKDYTIDHNTINFLPTKDK